MREESLCYMFIKNIIAFGLFLLCFGCAEVKKKEALSPTAPTETFGTFFNDRDFDEICQRIAKLDITVVAPGSGIDSAQRKLMERLVFRYHINIPQSAIANKSFYSCADTKENRIKFFNAAVRSKHEIIWAVRGWF